VKVARAGQKAISGGEGQMRVGLVAALYCCTATVLPPAAVVGQAAGMASCTGVPSGRFL